MPEQPLPLELSEPLPEQVPLAPAPRDPGPRGSGPRDSGSRDSGSRDSGSRDSGPLRPERRRGEEKAYFARRRRGSGLGGWLLFLLVLAGLAAAGWYWRHDIVAAVPESARVYQWLGVEVDQPVAGRLELVNYTFMRRLVDSERRLVVSGEVVNRAAETLKVPPLRARVLDQSGNELLTWDFAANEAQLAPGASTRFESQHEHPDYAGEINVEVEFLPMQ